MSYLSLELNTAASSAENPLKSSTTASISFNVAGLALDIAEGFSLSLDPYEEKVIASTRKTLAIDSSTQLQITQPYNNLGQESLWRILWVGGTNPNFRTRRSLTLSQTTVVDVVRLSDIVTRINFSEAIGSNIKLNDILLFEKDNDIGLQSPFNAVNTGVPCRIVGVSSNFIDVEDMGVLVNDPNVLMGVDYLDILKVFSSSGAQVTDTVNITSSSVNYGNRGSFKIVFVSADYIDIEAPSLVPETVSNVSDGFKIFVNTIYYIALKAKGAVKLNIDETELNLSLLNDTAVFAGSVSCSEVVVKNTSDGMLAVEGLWCASGLNGTEC